MDYDNKRKRAVCRAALFPLQKKSAGGRAGKEYAKRTLLKRAGRTEWKKKREYFR